MYVYNIKSTEQVKILSGGNMQDLITAIKYDDENHFPAEVKEACKRKQELIQRYGIYHRFHMDEI
jgi:hypothetical protein